MEPIVFIDSEIGIDSKKILDLGAITSDDAQFHSTNVGKFKTFVGNYKFVCGHNIIHHDLKYIGDLFDESTIFIDTLYMSPLLFPQHPYHNLVKDDKLQVDDLNNPLNDSIKAKELFYDEVSAFKSLSRELKWIFCSLLYDFPEFQGFFKYLGFKSLNNLSASTIKLQFDGKTCSNADYNMLVEKYPVELAYALAIINCDDKYSITPPWVLKNFPFVTNVIKMLRGTPCKEGCNYCNNKANIFTQLKDFFGYDEFRKFDGEPLQEDAVRAAVNNESLLAIFPTGGGKSLTFQLPALIAGKNYHGLTVVISPLQSLMKDQVDNLEKKGIGEAVTINGLLSPLERQEAIERVQDGRATILYIAPESLRSRTIEKLLISRNISRFVIDEAHCFSAWGQDFRVDYLFIADFIKQIQKKKGLTDQIPVSCFTATAKQKVITDICEYFKRNLDLDLKIYATKATRTNLHYSVLYKETEDEKYIALRRLIEEKKCPTIVYVSRTKKTEEIANKLSKDGYPALPFNGKMDVNEKIENQNAFMKNDVQIIVATSAFGMGVDKSDVKLVVHYDISDSLENYMQEAGRAGRDQSLKADCYILFNDSDLDKHFVLLNQTKLSISEIQQVWKAIKDNTKNRNSFISSALEIARNAGWDDSSKEIETRVKTAVAALERAGYIKRGMNCPKIYATSIIAKNMADASYIIEKTNLLSKEDKELSRRILSFLLSARSVAEAGNDSAESRVDYIADKLGTTKDIVIDNINVLRQLKLLSDDQDMSAYVPREQLKNKALQTLEKFLKLESFILDQLGEEINTFNLRELNDLAINSGLKYAKVKDIKKILLYWVNNNFIEKTDNMSQNRTDIIPKYSINRLKSRLEKKHDICEFIVKELYKRALFNRDLGENVLVKFSLVGLFNLFNERIKLEIYDSPVVLKDIADGLLYLSKIDAIQLQGGFLVSYSPMEIKRLVMDNKIRYKNEDYKLLNDFYKQKIQQIHIVGEFANLMVKDYNSALQFVNDYFQIDFKKFINKYFKGERLLEIERNITPEKYKELFGKLSDRQKEIIENNESQYIVVAAGPGSGKTMVLVHKLASLLLLEDVKHEQLLMLTFSRAAATEFKKRLIDLIGNSAHYVEIKTFHSYCFDLLGQIGNLETSENVVSDATEMINNGEVEFSKITKKVLVIDEAQDMDINEFNLVKALINKNEDMRVIAVGDDDQNIYEFRGSNSKYMKELVDNYGATQYEMVDNYRSKQNIVEFSNEFLKLFDSRLKTEKCVSTSGEKGEVKLVQHISDNLEEPIVEHIIKNKHSGTTAVLTSTNEEALRVLGLLNKNRIPAKLIQSMDDFNMINLVEIRYFLSQIDGQLETPIIPNDLWDFAMQNLFNAYGNSSAYEICEKMLDDFAKINKIKYRTDLNEYICESKYEDFYTVENGIVLVSTIHKAKGREFDRVYLLLNKTFAYTDEQRRKIYVGMTRAKNELYINCNNGLFSNVNKNNVKIIRDNKDYSEPEEIMLQLSHRDVFLGYFKGKADIIKKLQSGDLLQIENSYIKAVVNGRSIALGKFSKAFQEKINKLEYKGYKIVYANIRFMLYWKGKDEDEEVLIFLPDINMKK